MHTYLLAGHWQQTPTLERFAQGIRRQMQSQGYHLAEEHDREIQLVFHFVDAQHPRHFRRQGKGTFVVTVAESAQPTHDIFRTAYPILIRSLGNMMIYRDQLRRQTYIVTLEQGCYQIGEADGTEAYFAQVFERVRPLATAQFVIDNHFEADLDETLWEGDQVTASLSKAGKQLDQMNLLPAPFPIEELLSPREMRHIKLLYGIGGLSYGNLSARQDKNRFWMSASGVDKSNLRTIGRDILLIKGYDEQKKAMKIGVPKDVEPRRASVDAIEHWMIYNEHPQVGAIVHIHAWMEGVPSTEMNYPCGTLELAQAVADQVRQAEDPSRAVIGLKNHGLTITGHDLDDIFARIEGRIIPQVPMS